MGDYWITAGNVSKLRMVSQTKQGLLNNNNKCIWFEIHVKCERLDSTSDMKKCLIATNWKLFYYSNKQKYEPFERKYFNFILIKYHITMKRWTKQKKTRLMNNQKITFILISF